YNDPCDDFTTNFAIRNSTGCHNTTRHIHACYTDTCANADIHYRSFFNGDFIRNRTTHIHVCYTDHLSNFNPLKLACAIAGAFVDDTIRAFLDVTCI
ncbi:unnamed protein product, partial [Rotaria sp. Silwood2]